MSNRGFTLLEVMIATAISMVGVSIFLAFIFSSRKHVTSVDRSILLKELLTNNVIEVKGLPIADLTPIDKCLMRTYRIDQAFVSEAQVDLVDGKCPIPNLGDNRLYVTWQTEPASVIQATFSTPALKLPIHSDVLRMVTLQSFGWNEGSGKITLHNKMVVFKR